MKNLHCIYMDKLPPAVAPAVSEIRFQNIRCVLCARLPALVKLSTVAGFLFLTLAVSAQNPNSIIYSKHNLSVSGPGTVRSSTESEVCIFCHAPHNATGDGPLWNHAMSVAAYTPYSSSTLKATVGQPTGASKLCLSCHDGTVALGMVGSRPMPIAMQPGTTTIPAGRTLIGTDLSAHHPVSFTYDMGLATAQGELRDPATLVQAVRLDKNGELQCTSCHDPHNNQFGSFLVQDNTSSALCLQCHTPNQWATSAHATSTATWNGNGSNPWPHTSGTTVAANACENCHRPHAAENPKRLLNFTPDEQNCLSCHGGTVAAKDIADELNKISVHPIIQTSGIHDAAEDPLNSPRHVACEDCHNPHATKATAGPGLDASGSLAGVVGVNSSGAVVKPIQFEYELCFRCHGNNSGNNGAATVQRQFVQTNTRLQFNPASASFHPVEVIGKNSLVPSLILPQTVSSLVSCIDCHNNDQGPAAGGSGPNGPHGSNFAPLLERNLSTVDFLAESPQAYDLCYKCHDRNSILANQSFQFHSLHVVDNQTACTTCHDSHGVALNAHLINFNTTYVTPSSNGRLEYISTGMNSGVCSLTCHGADHNAFTYPQVLIPTGSPRRLLK